MAQDAAPVEQVDARERLALLGQQATISSCYCILCAISEWCEKSGQRRRTSGSLLRLLLFVGVAPAQDDFVKHVHKPKGSRYKVLATLNGKTWNSTVGAKQIIVRVDLRGLPKATYTLHVAVTYTKPNGKRATVRSASQVDYHTCTPKPLG